MELAEPIYCLLGNKGISNPIIVNFVWLGKIAALQIVNNVCYYEHGKFRVHNVCDISIIVSKCWRLLT